VENFVLKGQICYSVSPTEIKTIENGYIVCVDGKSRGVFEKLPSNYQNLTIKDFGDHLIIPGLTDAHVHAPQFEFRTLGMDLELLDWLNTHTFPTESKYADVEYANRAYQQFVKELVTTPNTRAIIFGTLHVPATITLMNQLEASGHVTLVGKVNMDRNGFETLEEENAENSILKTVEWLESIQGKYQRTMPIITPRFIPCCTDQLTKRLGKLARKYKLPVQSHLSENLNEVAWVKELAPESKFYGDAYDRLGLFGDDIQTIMAHCVWSSEEEIALMKDRNVFVAHCPSSNTHLSSGIAPIRKFMNNGLNIALGSDIAGGTHTSILRAMADAIQVSKLYWRYIDQNDKPLTIEEAFYLGTIGGGSFFGKVGSFAEGYEFDAVVLGSDENILPQRPELTLLERLTRCIYLGDNQNVAAKFVRGQQIV